MTMQTVEIRHAHFFCGLGGAARGFNRGSAKVKNLVAKFRCIGGIDNDPASVRDFEKLAGVPATLLDLFSTRQYREFHGHAPPQEWREAVPTDIHRAFGHERPHIVFLSPPCKGFSGLLSERTSQSSKYQALNELTLRGVFLLCEAYASDPVELIIFENVPRIMIRGRPLLDEIGALLRHYGYAVAETEHNCGEIGGLAQSRKRFLLVARHMEKVKPFLYEPEKKRMRGVGEVLSKLPIPGTVLPESGMIVGGAMHRMPSLQWRTWVRLAFVEAGADWRSLNRLSVENGFLRDYGVVPETRYHNGAYGVADWHTPSNTVTGSGRPACGVFSVADPRIAGHGKSVQLGVRPWNEPAATVTGQGWPGQGPFAVSDPRLTGKPRFNNVFRIVPWHDPSPAVAGPGGPAGGLAVADPRTPHSHNSRFGVKRWNEPAGVIAGESLPTNGSFAVADPRAEGHRHGKGKYRVTRFDEPAGCVIAASTTGQGAFAVADPRTGINPVAAKAHSWKVADWRDTAGTVTTSRSVGSGALSVADPRTGWPDTAHQSKLSVQHWDKPSKTVTGSDRVGSGALCIADPRWLEHKDEYKTQGNYGVVAWQEHTGGITAAGQHDNGRWSVADPRGIYNEFSEFSKVTGEADKLALPDPGDRLVAVIRALDDTWHRPFTTLELAAIQSLVDPDQLFELDGRSDSAWRERIGNAVPSDAAAAVASTMGRTLLLAWSGESFVLSSEAIWVSPLEIALATADQHLPDEVVTYRDAV